MAPCCGAGPASASGRVAGCALRGCREPHPCLTLHGVARRAGAVGRVPKAEGERASARARARRGRPHGRPVHRADDGPRRDRRPPRSNPGRARPDAAQETEADPRTRATACAHPPSDPGRAPGRPRGGGGAPAGGGRGGRARVGARTRVSGRPVEGRGDGPARCPPRAAGADRRHGRQAPHGAEPDRAHREAHAGPGGADPDPCPRHDHRHRAAAARRGGRPPGPRLLPGDGQAGPGAGPGTVAAPHIRVLRFRREPAPNAERSGRFEPRPRPGRESAAQRRGPDDGVVHRRDPGGRGASGRSGPSAPSGARQPAHGGDRERPGRGAGRAPLGADAGGPGQGRPHTGDRAAGGPGARRHALHPLPRPAHGGEGGVRPGRPRFADRTRNGGAGRGEPSGGALRATAGGGADGARQGTRARGGQGDRPGGVGPLPARGRRCLAPLPRQQRHGARKCTEIVRAGGQETPAGHRGVHLRAGHAHRTLAEHPRWRRVPAPPGSRRRAGPVQQPRGAGADPGRTGRKGQALERDG